MGKSFSSQQAAKSEKHLENVKKKQKKEHCLAGVFHSAAGGFGFVECEGRERDFYVGRSRTHGAFEGDSVMIRVLRDVSGKSGLKAEAEVVRVLSHSLTDLVGTCHISEEGTYFVPDNRKISVDFAVRPRAQEEENREQTAAVPQDGWKVVLTITDYGSERRNPAGYVSEIIGPGDDRETKTLAMLRALEIPAVFPLSAAAEAEKVPRKAIFSGNDADAGMIRDLRETVMVTVDGLDARDLDDAVSLDRDPEGREVLGVHIADVSRYVTEGSALDAEALNRGTSVYLPDRVIPMLPEALSNGICSLNEGEDRYAMSCLMTLDAEGRVISSEITESIIRVRARLSYEGVMTFFEEGSTGEIEEHLKKQGFERGRGLVKHTGEITSMLKRMRRLSEKLSVLRRKRGAIDFDIPEPKIVLDETGRPAAIEARVSSEATLMVENFMLLANETVASSAFWTGIPFVYRTHAEPDEQKVRELCALLRKLGIPVKSGGKIHPAQVQQILDRVKGMPEEATLIRMTLRSMSQAGYTTECGGHFGLALKYYCHFTSPIRRYPDLQIHRILREQLRGALTEERADHYREILDDRAHRSSVTERRADDAERQADRTMMAEYMAERLGEEYTGIVSGVTGHGIYVTLPNLAEGLVPVASLTDDYYVFDEKSYILKGERRGREFSLGQEVSVRVTAADTEAGTIDFELTGTKEAGAGSRKYGKEKRAGKARRKQ